MKLYDISQEVFSCCVFPGDPAPTCTPLMRMEQGDMINLTAFNMCAHNGTHVDAPFHFYRDGKTLDQVKLEKFVGYCYVVDFDGIVTAEDARRVLEKAALADGRAAKKLLFKGKTTISREAAKVLAGAKIDLVGNESQTVGPEEGPMEVHLTLLGAEVVLLEGVRLNEVPEGVYFLDAAPINLGGTDGAPCRSILIEGL